MFKRYPVGREVVANLKSGKAFRGLLWARKFGCWVLRNAELIIEDEVIAVDNEVIIEAGELDFMQVGPFKGSAKG